jgi:hypothetical protein
VTLVLSKEAEADLKEIEALLPSKAVHCVPPK